MSNLSISESTQSEFSKIADGISLAYLPVHMGSAVAHAFFVTYKIANSVSNSWRKAANFIAINYQANIENAFGRWNCYLFFQVSESLTLELKYQIENDTFSTRKIVIVGDISCDEIINQHILNRDLQITITSGQEQQGFVNDELLWSLLDGRVLKVKKRTAAAEDTFDELYEALKNERR